jgi:hypothetical protein
MLRMAQIRHFCLDSLVDKYLHKQDEHIKKMGLVMKLLGWLFFWLASVTFGADALLSLEQQSITLARLGEVSAAMGGAKLLPAAVSAIPTIIPLVVLGIVCMALAIRRSNSRASRKRRIFGKGQLR